MRIGTTPILAFMRLRTAGLFAVLMMGALLLPAAAMADTGGSHYVSWENTGTNFNTGGPHRGYALTTRKCVVCHSVHNAPSTTDTYTSDAEVLLRSSVADACTFCHISTNIGGLQIYGGVASSYEVDDVYGHNGSFAAECADCHAPHGANTFGGAVAGKVLKRGGAPQNTTGNVQVEAAAIYSVMNGGDLFNGTTDRHAQISAFCTECHKVWTAASEDTITASGFTFIDGVMTTFTDQTYQGHPLVDDSDALVAEGATFNGRVAWGDSLHCRSCHAAGTENLANSYTGMVISSFPHYTPNRARFLVAGWGAGDPDATAIGAGNAVNDAAADGVCLRCHVDHSGASGVGKTY